MMEKTNKTSANSLDFVIIAISLKKEFDKIVPHVNIDQVIIENQIGPIANRMKMIQGMIAQYRRGDDGVNMQERFGNVGPEPAERSSKRPEMKGPSDISDLLSGLKTKTINIQQQQSQNQNQNSQQSQNTLSVHELNDIPEIKQPLKTKRKQKSDKNTISLDI